MVFANLTPGSRRQDHTTSPPAASVFVQRAFARLTLSASIASRPTFVTTAKRPSHRGGTAQVLPLICASEKPKYFCRGGWTAFRKPARRANQQAIARRKTSPRSVVATEVASSHHRPTERRCGIRIRPIVRVFQHQHRQSEECKNANRNNEQKEIPSSHHRIGHLRPAER
jgi:hypothetical protein